MITILVPTYNRSDFIIRMLRYYNETRFKGCILIGDSSTSDHVEKTRRAIGRIKNLSITYREFPGLKLHQCIFSLLQYISTPYVTYLPDDDLLVTNVMEECRLFLDKHPDYSAALGVGALFKLESDGPYGKFFGTSRYGLRSFESEKASQRLWELADKYCVAAYSIRRREQFCLGFANAANIADVAIGAELLPTFLLVIQGKVKRFNRFFLAHQIHEKRYLMPDLFNWVISPDWSSSYQILFESLSKALAKQDEINIEIARTTIRRALWFYIGETLEYKWKMKYASNQTFLSFLKGAAKSIPEFPLIWHTIRSYLPIGNLMLPALLRTSSPYHKDFIGIYEAIQNRNCS